MYVERDAGETVVFAVGALRRLGSRALWTAIEPEIGARSLVVDLSAVTVVDSWLLTVLARGWARQDEHGLVFWVENPSKKTRRFLHASALRFLLDNGDRRH